MSTEIQSAEFDSSPSSAVAPARPFRIWPAVLLIVAYWALRVATNFMELAISAQFFTSVIGPGLLFLLFLIWWMTHRGIRLTDRLAGFGAVVGGTWLAARWSDPSIGLFGVLIFGLPIGLTLWTAWLWLGGRRSVFVRRWGAPLAMLPVWIMFLLVRMTNLYGDLHADMTLRWTPTAEERLIAERAREAGKPKSPPPSEPAPPLALEPGDWPGLRGPERNGEVRRERIATDWEKSPPKQVWRAKIGPAWSSFAVVGNRLFTQEQRDQDEAVVCLDATTGIPIWIHEDKARHWESQGGAGPRATPTFDGGRIYSLGATGILNCLDAPSGELKWTRNIAADAKTEVPMWGFSGSPLVVGDVVIVYTGGGEKGLLGYRAANGDLAWTAPTGTQGYSSPQLLAIGGEQQVVVLDDAGVVAVDPASGAVRWRLDAPTHDWRAAQPHSLGDSQVLAGSGDLGLVLIDLKHSDLKHSDLKQSDLKQSDLKQSGATWTAARQWSSKGMKPEYNDFVVLNGSVYGFDGGIFCCVDAATGQRRWKGGHYGHGQVLLLADQRLLLVLSETGEAVLIAANPEKHEELGKFQALEGKTWNHPVVAHGRLYVRNNEEMACYDLGSTEVR